MQTRNGVAGREQDMAVGRAILQQVADKCAQAFRHDGLLLVAVGIRLHVLEVV